MTAFMRVRRRLSRASASEGARLTLLTLYYLAIIVGLVLTHLTPDYSRPPFIYQAF
jgi:hypothetical protein